MLKILEKVRLVRPLQRSGQDRFLLELAMNIQVTRHALARKQQRAIPPLIESWLDAFGEEEYDGHGGVRVFFSRRSIRRLERAVGRQPVRRLSHLLDTYRVESSTDGATFTYARRTRRMWRR